MEISVFDERRNVVVIQCNEILQIKRVKKRLCYETVEGNFYGSASLEDEAKLRYERDFRIINKNCLINMEKVDRIEDGFAVINGSKYPIASRRIKNILKNWK